ncbi:hypothetical protein DX902_00875 [Paenibacillus jamilae]|nr:hypothetical protein DX902_00875 [Paenibacillus jamilae]
MLFLEDNPEELLPGLVTIMETALLHLVNVDDLLKRFSEKIEDFGILEDATIELTILDSCIIRPFTMLNIKGIKVLYRLFYCF